MTQRTADDALTAGREALARHAWHEAFEALRQADRDGRLTAEDLDGLGEAAWWIGQTEAQIDARERAYAAYVQAGERRKAAVVALALAREHWAGGAMPQASGWFRRTEQLLAEEPEGVEHGLLARTRANIAIDRGELDLAIREADRALDIGTRFGDRDLQALALHDKGEALVVQGRMTEGLALIDEAMVGAVGGELSPIATGMIYCNTVNACSRLADYRRAGEWTEAAKRWCERQAIGGFPGVCRVHRAEITRLRGKWLEAEAEARQACDELSARGLFMFSGLGFYEIGEIRLRMGDLSASEEAFTQADEQGRDPQPGLALLRLAQGKPEVAASMLGRAVEDAIDPLERARLLPAQAEVALAVGNVETARKAADELEDIASRFEGVAAQQARAATARGLAQLGDGRASDAVRSFRRARQLWSDEDLPYEAARARAWLGEAYRAAGDDDAAALELRAAKAAFDKLGAVPDEMRAAELLEEGAQAAGARVVRTFMFTDIEGSTSLAEAIGDEAWEGLLSWHDQTLRALFAANGGEEVDQTGDGFFVAFPDAASALRCAVEIQRSLAEHRRSHGFAPRVRIGVHAAEATQQGENFRGVGVHAAARVGALGGGGEIVASEETVGTAGDGFRTSDPREVRLKGIADPVRVVTVEWR